MGLMVTGDCLGERQRSGRFDDGREWNVREVVVLDGVDTIPVRIERLTGNVPARGEFVALSVEQRGNKLHATSRNAEVEKVLASKG